MPPPIRIWLVEDDPKYRRSFEQLVATSDEFEVEYAFESYEDLAAHPVTTLPDLVAMDLQLPGFSGIEATRDLRRLHPDLRIVFLTLVDRAESIFEALRAGATGYVTKGAHPDEIFRSLKEAYAGATYFEPSVARHVLHFFSSKDASYSLSEREVQVLSELASGLSKSRIATKLFLSPHTVDSHLRSVYSKLHVTTAAEAAAKAVRAGII